MSKKTKRVNIEQVKASPKKGFPNADKVYVKIPHSLFCALTDLYSQIPSNEFTRERERIHNVIKDNNYEPFVNFMGEFYDIDLAYLLAAKKKKPPKFDPKELLSLMRRSQDGGNVDVFKYLNEEEIFNRLKKIYIEHLGLEQDKINLASPFNPTNHGADSLDTVELAMAMEEEFNISISDEVADELYNVSEKYNLTFDNLVSLLKQLPS